MREPLLLLQHRMVEAITGVPLAAHFATRSAADMVVGTSARDAAFRLGVYRSMHESRLHDFLVEDFPRVRALLGHEHFEAVVRGYLRAWPSRSHHLGELGTHLPAFLSEHPLVDRADLPDVARLDALRNAVFDDEDDTPLGFAELAESFTARDARPLRRVRASALLSTAWDVERAWSSADNGEPASPSPWRATQFVVWRCNHVVRHRSIDRVEMTALTALAKGVRPDDLCALLSDDGGPQRVFDVLSGWAADALLTR